MLNDEMFQDSTETTVSTAYAKIRKARNLTQPQVSSLTGIPIKRLCDYERGRADPSKQDIKLLERAYQCEGKLLLYWLSKFSVDMSSSWWQKTKEKLLRWWHSEGAEKE